MRSGKPKSGLTSTIVRWFGGIFLLLYLVACGVVLVLDQRNARRDLEVLLYAEVEGLASYLATTGRLDFPELQFHDREKPFPLWVRVIENGKLVAATPGLPALPFLTLDGEATDLRFLSAVSGETFVGIAHRVWNQPGRAVEALASSRVLAERRRNLVLLLALTGLILVPFAGLGGWILAQGTTRPIARLVASVRAADPAHLGQRVLVPDKPLEVHKLATAFNELLARLEDSVTAMRQFTADASHELRTPVSIMRTGLEVTLRGQPSVEDYRALLRDNLKEITRVQRVVESLLLLARDPQATSDPQLQQPTDLAAISREVIGALKPHADDKRVELRGEIPPELWVLGQADHLYLMLLNLLDNAVRHTPAGRQVDLELSAADGWVRVVVTDQGPGIPLAERPFIFERYYRARHAVNRMGGLGLSVVRWVVERHGGQVRVVDSEPPGARFEVLLPPAAAVLAAEATADA